MQHPLQEPLATDGQHTLLPSNVLVPHTAEFDQDIQLCDNIPLQR